jgi:4-amino-4-deoxy-L-arabinose transferase-like glycosyltransferase
MKMNRSQKLTFLAILAASFFLRLGLSLYYSKGFSLSDEELIDHYVFDQKQYLSLAQHLASQGEFSSPYARMTERAPGWPFLLSLYFRLFGVNESFRLLQVLIGTVFCCMVFVIVRKLTADRLAPFLSMLLAAVWPQFVIYSARAYSEPLFLLLISIAMSLAFVLRMRPSAGTAVLLGLVLAAATYVRPQGVLYASTGLFTCFMPCALVSVPLQRRIGLAVILATTIFISVVPWIYRNYTMTGRVSFIVETGLLWGNNNPTLQGLPLFDGRLLTDASVPDIDSVAYNKFLDDCVASKGVSSARDPWEVRQVCGQQMAWDFIVNHPATYVKLAFTRFVKFVMPFPLGLLKLYSALLGIAWIAVFPLGFMYLFSSRFPLQVRLLLWLPLLLEASLALLLSYESRYRLGAELLLIAAAAMNSADLFRRMNLHTVSTQRCANPDLLT